MLSFFYFWAEQMLFLLPLVSIWRFFLIEQQHLKGATGHIWGLIIITISNPKENGFGFKILFFGVQRQTSLIKMRADLNLLSKLRLELYGEDKTFELHYYLNGISEMFFLHMPETTVEASK